MAHNLATINGQVAMAYQGETPWHSLGTRIDAAQARSISAALAAASLDWTVALQPVFAQVGDQMIAIDTRRAVVRDTDQAVLGVVSKWYEPIQNAAFETVFGPVMDEFGLTVEAAGALGQGERAWMLFKLPSTLEPVPGDAVNGYGLAILAHDGSACYEFRPTPIRVVCQNTLTAAVGAGGRKGPSSARTRARARSGTG